MNKFLYIFVLLYNIGLSQQLFTKTLQWPPVSDESVYAYAISYGDDPEYQYDQVYVTNTSVTFTNLIFGKDYYFTVYSISTNGNMSHPSRTLGLIYYTIPNGYSIISSKLCRDDNDFKISLIYTNFVEGTIMYQYDPNSGYKMNVYEFEQWLDPNQNFIYGTGSWVFNPGPAYGIYVWGNVISNSFTNVYSNNKFYLTGYSTSKTGYIQKDLGYIPSQEDYVYKFENGGWKIYSYDFGQWTIEPIINKNEGFFIFRNEPLNWVSRWNRVF